MTDSRESLTIRMTTLLAALLLATAAKTAGAEPLAITDCLNFGNPEKPEVSL